jgi:hypothetical protein
MRREISAVFVGFRLGGAFNPFAPSDRLVLRMRLDAEIEGALYARPAADTSLYLSVLLGVTVQRFEGPAPLDGPGAIGTFNNTAAIVGLRGGVEALRTADVRVFGFAEIGLPVSPASDPDHGVINQWVPSVGLGAGLLF